MFIKANQALKLGLIFIFCISTALSNEKKSDEYYWENTTEVNFNLIISLLSIQSCYEDGKSLFLCINATKSLLGWSDLEKHAVLIKGAPLPRNSILKTKTLVEDFKFFGLYKVTLEEVKEEEKISSFKYYHDSQKDKADKIAFLDKVLNKKLNKESFSICSHLSGHPRKRPKVKKNRNWLQ